MLKKKRYIYFFDPSEVESPAVPRERSATKKKIKRRGRVGRENFFLSSIGKEKFWHSNILMGLGSLQS